MNYPPNIFRVICLFPTLNNFTCLYLDDFTNVEPLVVFIDTKDPFAALLAREINRACADLFVEFFNGKINGVMLGLLHHKNNKEIGND